MKNCKECLNSRLIISENGYIPICTLPDSEAIRCLTNERSEFVGNELYLKVGGKE